MNWGNKPYQENNILGRENSKNKERKLEPKEEAAKMEKEYGTLKDSTKDDNPRGKTEEPKGIELIALGWQWNWGSKTFITPGRVIWKSNPNKYEELTLVV